MTKFKADTRLSYSSGELVRNCTQKYFYKKIAQIKPDVEEDFEAFSIGKAFHLIQEKLKHKGVPKIALVKKACKVNKAEGSEALIHGMALKYHKLNTKIGLTCVATEFEISNEKFVGYVDAVLKDAKGNWWIIDLKTAGRLAEDKLLRLHTDTQLNLYSFFAPEISKMFKLDLKKFKGARYRVTTKPTIRRANGEDYATYVKRIFRSANSIDVEVSNKSMNASGAYELHLRDHDLTMKLRSKEEPPKRNFSYCFAYFKPCEYWSQCHGSKYEDAKRNLKMVDADK